MDAMDRRLMLGAAGLAGVAAVARLAQAGPLNPPAGPVGPTGHSTDELWAKIARTDAGLAEPRVPVQSLGGSATALHVISQPGSYYLTGNIQGEAGKDGIEIAADGVTVDLRGFVLQGTTDSQSAVLARAGVQRIRIHNGRVDGWTAPWPRNGAIDLLGATRCVVDHVQVAATAASTGVAVGSDSLIERCVGTGNALSAFFVRPAATVRDCASFGNGAADPNYHGGVFAFYGGAAIERLVSHGDWVGVRVEDTGIVTGCKFTGARNWAIRLGGRCTVIDNEILSSQNGISAFAQSVIARNSICGSGGAGIRIEAGSGKNRIMNNHLIECNDGIRIEAPSTANFITGNTVNVFAGSPYSIPAGNAYGPIVNASGIGDISIIPDANHPLANFVH